MSMTSVIESYLQTIEQGIFQRLMNNLLQCEGYNFAASPGTGRGSNKTSKGSPDSFFIEGDKYIFCECTTQEKVYGGKKLMSKLLTDIDHCFDFNKTQIEKQKISKVILCFTEKISAEDDFKLKEQVKSHNLYTELIIYSLQNIPYKLLYYPGVADRYIPGIKTTSSFIHTLSDYLNITDKGLQPSLKNAFIGREKELIEAKSLLHENDILVIAGSQGIGKSKLAIHIAEIFEKEENYEARIITSGPVPIWDDLPIVILPNRQYIIVLDDANRALHNLAYLLQFAKEKSNNNIKIIVTVRDYVYSSLREALSTSSYNEVIVKPFEDGDIKKIIHSVLGHENINPIIVDSIITISKGNCRLAMMAIRTIIKENNAKILTDVFSLYDDYFDKVKTELSIIDTDNTLRALGILSFFGVLDRNNVVVEQILKEKYGIDWNDLWETFLQLEKHELVDVFSKETARLSDQVLATYVFYKAFINEDTSLINYSSWCINFIDSYERRIRNTLIDTINTFGFTQLKSRITSLISGVLESLDSESSSLKFLNIFWFYKEHDALLYVKKWIESLDCEDAKLEDINFEIDNNIRTDRDGELSLLIEFWNHDMNFLSESINLGLQIAFKTPSRIPQLVKAFSENFGYKKYDYTSNYKRQLSLINTLTTERSIEIESTIQKEIFLSLYKIFFDWEHTSTEGKGGKIIIHRFNLLKNDGLIELRSKIINTLFNLFHKSPIKVLKVFKNYIWNISSSHEDIYKNELNIVGTFIKTQLQPSNYVHCKLVDEYIDALKKINIDIKLDFDDFTKSNIFIFGKKFDYEYIDDDIDYSESETEQKRILNLHFEGKDIDFITDTFDKLGKINNDLKELGSEHLLDSSIRLMFIGFADNNISAYYHAIKLVIDNKCSFGIHSGNVITYPIINNLLSLKELYSYLSIGNYNLKQFWKGMFFQAIQEEKIDVYFFDEFIEFIRNVKGRFALWNAEQYVKFNSIFLSHYVHNTIHNNVVSFICEELINRENEIDLSFDYDFCLNCNIYFTNNKDLIKKIYFLNESKSNSYDHNGKEFESICNLDSKFILEYLKCTAKKRRSISSLFERVKLDFIWTLEEGESIISEALEFIIKEYPMYSSWEHEANVLFKIDKNNIQTLGKTLNFISAFIAKNYNLRDRIEIIFNVIVNSFPNELLNFLRQFLILNNDIEFARRLWLEESGIISGSRVPKIESHIKLVESILDMVTALPNPMNYIDHINHWNRVIEYSIKDKKRQLKEDFAGWDY